MSDRYTFSDRMFMRRARFMSAWYGKLFELYDWLGWQEKANIAFDKCQDWWERGWECSIGM